MKKSTYIWSLMGFLTSGIGLITIFFPSLFNLEHDRISRLAVHLDDWESVLTLERFLERNKGRLIELEMTSDAYRVIALNSKFRTEDGERLSPPGILMALGNDEDADRWGLRNATKCPIMTAEYLGKDDSLRMVFNNRAFGSGAGGREHAVLDIQSAQNRCEDDRGARANVLKLWVEDTEFVTVAYNEDLDFSAVDGFHTNRYFWVEGLESVDSGERDHWVLVPVNERDVKFKSY